jgi:hypothetical protein
MSLDIAPGGEGAPAPEAVAPAVDSNPISPQAAASALSQRRWEKARQPEPPAARPAPQVEAPQDLPAMADAAPETDPGETREAEPVEALPPIEPPRSWTKDEKSRFETLPRETQEYIASREQEREKAIRQSQNEAAEIRKAAEAERAQIAQQRQQYEARLPELMASLQAAQAGQFADVRTPQDVQRLASEDPLRYLQWTAHQQQVSAVHNEMRQAQERQTQEFQNQWSDFASREDRLAVEKIPELSNPEQRVKVQDAARSYLSDLGFSETELASAWNGQAALSPRDHRFQMLVMDAVRYREGKVQAKKAIAEKPLPAVQRPGTAPVARPDSNLQALSKKLEQTGSFDDAAAVIAARRASSRR